MVDRRARFPRGAALAQADLDADLHGRLAHLRETEPVSWVPALEAWLVSAREPALRVLRDSTTFTVDDPRFSTARVLGPSMLSLDGTEHDRHREPFAHALRPAEVQLRLADAVRTIADATVGSLAPLGRAELRRQLAGPLAVAVMAVVLDLGDVEPSTLLAWYDDIVAAVSAASSSPSDEAQTPDAVAALRATVLAAVGSGRGLLSGATRTLSDDEIVSNAGVMLFGGIETCEGMTANALAHVLADPAVVQLLRADRALVANAVDESLRLEPAVVRVDRFATAPVELGGASIGRGDFVIVSLAAANRDPSVFTEPDRFDPVRANAKQHLTFVHGPHACPGMHLARIETHCALGAVLDALAGVRLDLERPAPRPHGTVFRKPERVDAIWQAG